MAQYRTGIVSTTAGSNVVTGSADEFGNSPAWLANAGEGDEIRIGNSSIFFTIASVDSDTQLTLTANYPATNSGAEYEIQTDFTSNLGLPLLNKGDLNSHAIINRSLRLIDRLSSPLNYLGSVLDKDLNEAPGSPTEGDAYIVASGSPSGDAWYGHEGEIATATGVSGEEWSFEIPNSRSFVYVDDETAFYLYDGAEWVVYTIGPFALADHTHALEDITDAGTMAAEDTGNYYTASGTDSAISSAISALSLGTMATQNADGVDINGGQIDGTVIGGGTPAAGSFTTLGCSGALSIGEDANLYRGAANELKTDDDFTTAGPNARMQLQPQGAYNTSQQSNIYFQPIYTSGGARAWMAGMRCVRTSTGDNQYDAYTALLARATGSAMVEALVAYGDGSVDLPVSGGVLKIGGYQVLSTPQTGVAEVNDPGDLSGSDTIDKATLESTISGLITNFNALRTALIYGHGLLVEYP